MDEELRRALDEAGDRVSFRRAEGSMEAGEVRRWVDFVLEGGGLVLSGGAGQLPAALGLRASETGYSGEVTPAPGFEAHFAARIVESCPTVTGAGYALLRTGGDECVLLGAPRGAGWVAFSGCDAPFLVDAVHWLAAANGGRAAY